MVRPSADVLAQEPRQQARAGTALPDDMLCEKLTGDKEMPTPSATILKRGTDYYLCHPKSETFLSKAKTAAVAVRSTQTISCGDGSSDDCLREDTQSEGQIEQLADKTDLWRYFEKNSAAKADVILQFVAKDRASSSAQITLQVQDSDSGTWIYSEARPITEIENDVNRLVDHFIAKSGRMPLRSKEEMDKARQCGQILTLVSALQSDYMKRRGNYDFKKTHPLDAQMEECKLHWQDWVCLKHGETTYAQNWNESGQELQRKLSLELEDLQKLEQQINILRGRACPSP